MLPEAAEYFMLFGAGKNCEDPEIVSFPQMEDAKAACISLKWFFRKSGDRFDFSGERSVRQTNQIINQSSPFGRWNSVKIALSPSNKSKMFRSFACHAGSPSS